MGILYQRHNKNPLWARGVGLAFAQKILTCGHPQVFPVGRLITAPLVVF